MEPLPWLAHSTSYPHAKMNGSRPDWRVFDQAGRMVKAEMHEELESKVARWESTGAGRYYEVMVQQDLFGGWEVLFVWGGIGSRRGGHQCWPVIDAAQGVALMNSVARGRERRGNLRRIAA